MHFSLSNSYVFLFFISAPKRVNKMNLLGGRPSISEVTCLRECFPIRPNPPPAAGACCSILVGVCRPDKTMQFAYNIEMKIEIKKLRPM